MTRTYPLHVQHVLDRTVILGEIGSGAHGVSIPGTDDEDLMGIYVETFQEIAGFGEAKTVIYRTAEERTGKADAPSQPGDLDLTLHPLRKYLSLALKGNPTILNLLFQTQAAGRSWGIGKSLIALIPSIISRQVAGPYLGYMVAQSERLQGLRGQKRIKRPELVEQHGYDTKYAMHMLRLGMQGVQLLETGRLQLPMYEEQADLLLRVRHGRLSLDEVKELAGHLERRLEALKEISPLPEKPDKEKVERWLLKVYQDNAQYETDSSD